ncbi:tyrosine-type recombinase/integrase [Actinophytocola oryzae]
MGVTSTELTKASEGPWPGVDRPAELLREIAEWLGGYGNRATRRTYAEGLGLPVTATDLRDWLPASEAPTKTVSGSDYWASAVARYAAVVGARPSPGGGPPPAARGRLRHLHWFRWCATAGVDPLTATSTHVKVWLDALNTAGAAPATRDRMLATVKALYTHLADTGLAAGNPAALNRRRLGLGDAASTTGTVVLTTAQVKALYDAAATPKRGASTLDTARATAVVALFTLGLRVSELCGLDRGDLHVTRGRRALRVLGKGGKTRVVYLHKAAEDALLAYLRARDTTGTAGTTVTRRGAPVDEPLLVTRTGHRYRRQAVWQLLRRLSADAPLHPHALRHFYVTTAVEAGAQLVHIQADVGHSSIDTTEQVYNNAARDPSRSAVDLVGDVLGLDG